MAKIQWKVRWITKVWLLVVVSLLVAGCEKPNEEVVLRRINDVLIDISNEPMLRANALFYNPNKMRGKLKRIKVEIFVDGKKAAEVDQKLKTVIPSQGEFTVPLEVKLALKELSLADAFMRVIGGKKFEVHYKGSLQLSYHGLPIRVPVDYKDEVKVRL